MGLASEKPKSSAQKAGMAWASQTGASAECGLVWRGSDLGYPPLPPPLNDQEDFCPCTTSQNTFTHHPTFSPLVQFEVFTF